MLNILLKQKMDQDIALSSGEQQELVSAFNSEMEQLKNEKPEEYILLLKKISNIFSELNRDLAKLA